MSAQLICEAIRTQRLISFYYTGDTIPGNRTVEPHMLAYNEADNLSLSAWLVAGTSQSGGQGWREYLLESISSVTVLDAPFRGTRPGYNPTGGKKFHSVRCAL
jgi:predicted DNA-binding transcriptional regulator YafY